MSGGGGELSGGYVTTSWEGESIAFEIGVRPEMFRF